METEGGNSYNELWTSVKVIENDLRSIKASQDYVQKRIDSFDFVRKSDYDKDRDNFVRKEDYDNIKRLIYLVISGIVGVFYWVVQTGGGVGS